MSTNTEHPHHHHHRSASMPIPAGHTHADSSSKDAQVQPMAIPAPTHPSTANQNLSATSPPVNRPRRGSILNMFGLSPLDTTDSRPPGLSHSPSSSTSTETSASGDSYGLAQSAPAGPPAWLGTGGAASVGEKSPLSTWLRQLHDHPEEDSVGAQNQSTRLNRMGSGRSFGPPGMGTGARRLSFGWNNYEGDAANQATSPTSEDSGHFGLFRRLSMGSRSPQMAFKPDSNALSNAEGSALGLGDDERGRGLAPPTRRRSSVRKLSPMGERMLRGDGGWGN